jgi:hypothetical protein
MAKIKQPQKVLAIIGVIHRSDFILDEILDILSKHLGEVSLRSKVIAFTHTDYYSKEMGKNLLRQWFVFDKLVNPDYLTELKHITNKIENTFVNEAKGRKVNIDPGLITMSSLILASTKNYSHRIYIGKGIYAEVTLVYKGQKFVTLEWTYPDYRETETLKFFGKSREILKSRLTNKDNIRSNNV